MDNKQLTDLLHFFAKEKNRPDQSPYTSLVLVDAIAIGRQTGLSLQEVERAALASEILPERYSRNQKSLSCADQLRLLESQVAIIGLGGLGGTVTEILARLGIGHLTLVDGDVFDESNLNRQLLSSPARIGGKKALAAALRVQEINPAVQVRAIEEFFTTANCSTILEGVQLAVDCLDNIPARFVLEQACRRANIPMVSAAIAGSSGQATAVFPSDPGLKLIYGSPEKAPQKGIEASLGTLPFAAVYMAAVECAEVTTILLGKPPELRHRLFLAETCDHTSELLDLSSQL
ncbi:MAG: HesA/MoeB/ThiF family protein [Proteobacteria bacterium]|nr:HesA/MoeB/ThiF family protein [Pseudomonadota bacterium]